MFRRLAKEEAQSLLDEGRTGRLGCITERGPYVVPISYLFHDGDIYAHSAVGEKIHALRRDPRACFQVDEVRDEYRWRSVIAFGSYEEVTDATERESFKRRILTRFPHLTPVESLASDAGGREVVIFRIHVDAVTGVGEG